VIHSCVVPAHLTANVGARHVIARGCHYLHDGRARDRDLQIQEPSQMLLETVEPFRRNDACYIDKSGFDICH
jgi:hypothetical protein